MSRTHANEALKGFLIPQANPAAQTLSSGFLQGLSDTRAAAGRDSTGNRSTHGNAHSWTAAIGYMALIDQLGNAVKPKGHTGGQPSFERTLEFFTPLLAADRAALYALRNAFVHDFSLINRRANRPELTRRFAFVGDAAVNPVQQPTTPWDGATMNDPTMVTTVNLAALGDMVETMVTNLCNMVLADQLDPVDTNFWALIDRYYILRPSQAASP